MSDGALPTPPTTATAVAPAVPASPAGTANPTGPTNPAGAANAAGAANPAAPAASTAAWKLYVAAAIGAFFLGLTDFIRHGNDSTTMLLNGLIVPAGSEITLTPAILLMIPILGVIAAWIFRPSTEREAFALGFAVYSVFALAPEEENAKGEAVKTTIQVSSAPLETGFLLIGNAFAGETRDGQATATVTLLYEGLPPTATHVSVSNVTGGQSLGTYRVQDSLTLVGKPGDHLQLAFEAPGYERTAIELTLNEAPSAYTVELEESGTPLFIQRLTPAARTVAMPSNPAWGGMGAAGTAGAATAGAVE